MQTSGQRNRNAFGRPSTLPWLATALLCSTLSLAGTGCSTPEGPYYFVADQDLVHMKAGSTVTLQADAWLVSPRFMAELSARHIAEEP